MYNLSEQVRQQFMMRPTECFDERYSIQVKIKLARKLYDMWGNVLRNEPHISNLLVELEDSIRNGRQVMLDFGIVESCKWCDEEEGGSCCGAGLENKFDTYLLLINLLLGVNLPELHLRPDSCYLLTDRGCVLKSRLVLCVDFLCEKIISALSRDQLLRLQNISGDELLKSFRLYDAIKRFIRGTADIDIYRKVEAV